MSAPFRPAARTRTRTSPLPGSGSGRSSTTSPPSWMVTARTGRECTASCCGVVTRCRPRRRIGSPRGDESFRPRIARRTPAALAGGAHRPRGRGTRPRPDLPRRRDARRPRPARPPDPRLPGGRRLAVAHGALAEAGRLPAHPRGDGRERELLRRAASAPRGAARAARVAPGEPRRDRRPEPRRHARQGAGVPAAGPRGRRGGARLAAGGPVRDPPGGPAPGRGREPARVARRARPLQALLPRRRVLLLLLGGPRPAVAGRRRAC